MRRIRAALVWVFSLLFLLSANGQALAFLLCSDANCPMFANVQKARKSCCEQEKGPAKKSCSCCELSALPQMDKGPTKISIEVPSFEVAVLVNDSIQVGQINEVISVERILFRSDHSPPEPTYAPDLGRAPPAS